MDRFIGNPGAGKSTLISSLAKDADSDDPVAPSGFCAGVGLTKYFTQYISAKGEKYFDTPGLEDMESREEAALQIEKALKQNGQYRIFFVITLESGRVKPADVTTINTVMDAIKTEKAGFNVIINKVSPRAEKMMMETPKALASIVQGINNGDHKIDARFIKIIRYDESINDVDDAFIEIDAALDDFIHKTSAVINIEKVEKIKTDQYEALREKYETEMTQMRKEMEQGSKKYTDLVNQMADVQREFASAKAAAEAARIKAAADIENLKTDFEKTAKELLETQNRTEIGADEAHREEMAALRDELEKVRKETKKARKKAEEDAQKRLDDQKIRDEAEKKRLEDIIRRQREDEERRRREDASSGGFGDFMLGFLAVVSRFR